MNVGGVLRIWVPFLVVLGIVGVNLTHFGAAGVPNWWAVPLVVRGRWWRCCGWPTRW